MSINNQTTINSNRTRFTSGSFLSLHNVIQMYNDLNERRSHRWQWARSRTHDMGSRWQARARAYSENVNMAAESSEGLPISPSEKSLTGSLVSEENEKSVSRSPSTYSIREDKWPDLVVSRPRKLDAWWLPRRKYITR